jgi:hypothetical protein
MVQMQPRNLVLPHVLPFHPSPRLLLEYEQITKSLWNSCGWLCKRETYVCSPMKYGKFGFLSSKTGRLRPSLM